MIQQLESNLYLIQITLANNPLKELNAYLIRGERDLLIDTGFNDDICEAEMLAAFAELNVCRERLDIFITHFHSDHVGLAKRLLTPSSCLLCNWKIARITGNDMKAPSHKRVVDFIGASGCSLGDSTQQPGFLKLHEFDIGFTVLPQHVRCLYDGDIISYGGYRLAYIETPGHMYDHGCLYEADKQWLFCGDLILGDITPNIACHRMEDDTLKEYLESLDKIAAYPVSVAYCGHRAIVMDCQRRIAEIRRHHLERLAEVEKILSGKPLTLERIAAKMHWHIENNDWEHLPIAQKYFAMTEAMAHLVYLCGIGRAEMKLYHRILHFTGKK